MDKKKIKIAVISTAGILLAGTGIWFGVTKLQKATVSVYSMNELSQSVFGDMPSLEAVSYTHLTLPTT